VPVSNFLTYKNQWLDPSEAFPNTFPNKLMPLGVWTPINVAQTFSKSCDFFLPCWAIETQFTEYQEKQSIIMGQGVNWHLEKYVNNCQVY